MPYRPLKGITTIHKVLVSPLTDRERKMYHGTNASWGDPATSGHYCCVKWVYLLPLGWVLQRPLNSLKSPLCHSWPVGLTWKGTFHFRARSIHQVGVSKHLHDLLYWCFWSWTFWSRRKCYLSSLFLNLNSSARDFEICLGCMQCDEQILVYVAIVAKSMK